MMPGWQSRRVKCEACLACERATERFAPGEHRCPFSPETDGFAEFFEMFRAQLLAFEKRLGVVSDYSPFLKRELRGAVQCRRGVGIVSNVAECEYVVVLRELERRPDGD